MRFPVAPRNAARPVLSLVLLCLLGLLAPAAVRAQSQYKVVDLGTLGGPNDYSVAME